MIGRGLIERGRLGGGYAYGDGTTITLMGVSGDYWRIGDAGTTGHTLDSEDDLLVTGMLEVDSYAYFDTRLYNYGGMWISADDIPFKMGAGDDAMWLYETADTDARPLLFLVDESQHSGSNIPAFIFGEHTNLYNADINLLDEVVQPHLVTVENSGKYTSGTAATSSGANATMTETGKFNNSVIGDLVRVTAGTNATAGWYWITTVTDNDNVDLDRTWCTGAVSGGTWSSWHKISMVTPKAIYMPIYDGAPGDGDIDIDCDGATALDVGQANGRLYWRANNGWHYVDATAGLSMPKEERIDPNGNEFNIGDTVKLVIDRINKDGSFHAMPYRK